MREQIEHVSVDPRATVRDALAAINRGALGLALIVERESGRFAGLVTDGDLRRALLDGLGLDSPVEAVRRPEPIVGRVGMAAEEVASLFSEPIRAVPLLDEDGRVADLALFDSRVHLPVAAPFLGERELRYVLECVLTGWISSAGPFVPRFEELFAGFCGTRHAVAVSNGTAALHLALLGLGVGEGDEVLVPALTFVSTANAVTYTGATPVFVDSDPETWTIDPERAEAAVTERTRAIVPVHLYGHPADMDAVRAVAERHGLAVVEDAAEAHGARYRGTRVGSLGDAAIFSFYGNKIFTTGEGGMLVTDRDDVAERARMLRDHGTAPGRRYWHPVLGFNYRLTNLQAAVGVAQMERADEILAAKRRIAQRYAEGLRGVPGLTLPPEAPWAWNVYWLYSVLVNEDELGVGRDELIQALAAEGIETRPVFPPLNLQPVYARGERMPVAERLGAVGLSLPSSVGMRDEEVDRVAEAVASLARAPVR